MLHLYFKCSNARTTLSLFFDLSYRPSVSYRELSIENYFSMRCNGETHTCERRRKTGYRCTRARWTRWTSRTASWCQFYPPLAMQYSAGGNAVDRLAASWPDGFVGKFLSTRSLLVCTRRCCLFARQTSNLWATIALWALKEKEIFKFNRFN